MATPVIPFPVPPRPADREPDEDPVRWWETLAACGVAIGLIAATWLFVGAVLAAVWSLLRSLT